MESDCKVAYYSSLWALHADECHMFVLCRKKKKSKSSSRKVTVFSFCSPL